VGGGRIKQPDYFGQYHFFAWLYFMSLMKYIGILFMFSLKVILSFISNMRQQCVSTNGQKKWRDEHSYKQNSNSGITRDVKGK